MKTKLKLNNLNFAPLSKEESNKIIAGNLPASIWNWIHALLSPSRVPVGDVGCDDGLLDCEDDNHNGDTSCSMP